MKRSTYLHALLIVVTALILLALFYLPYWSVRNKTIDAFNNKQLILVQQAIKGIESFFSTYNKALQYFARQPSIAGLDESGRALMADFYSIHASEVAAVTRLDGDGAVLYTVPEEEYGWTVRNILSRERYSKQLHAGHLVLTEIFVAANDEPYLVFAVPILIQGSYSGSLGFLIPFEPIIKKNLAKLPLVDNGLVLMVSQQGKELYCMAGHAVPAAAGRCYVDDKAISLLKKKMLLGGQGTGALTAALLETDDRDNPPSRFAVYVPVRLPGGYFWSILIASPENTVLAAMHGFHSQWLAVTSIAVCVVLLLSYLLTRTLARNREEKKRRVVEEQLIRLLDFTPLGMVVYDINGRVTYINQAVIELLDGPDPDDVVGRSFCDFVHPDYLQFMEERFEHLIRGEAQDTAIVKLATPSGRIKDVEIDSTSFIFSGQTGFICMLRDVTEALQQEATQRRLVTAIEQANESVIITDQAGIVEYVNPAFTRTSGYSKEEIIGKNPRILRSGKHDISFYRTMWRTITSGRVWQGRIINRRKDGTLFTEMATISPVRDVTGKITHYVAVNRDVSHEVELESKLRQAQKMEAIGTLAGGIAHDFNNILGAILGFTDMALLQSDPSTPIHDTLLHIRKGGKRAADLVQQILTFSRQSSAEKKPIMVAPLIKESLQLLRASLPSTIRIHQEITAEDALVLADATQLQQIVINLCTNAFQAMRDLGGELTVRLDRIKTRDCQRESHLIQDSCLQLTVSDTGIGIEPAVAERIFDPFFTTKEPGEGTGMGLSVVHGIVSDLGGEIFIDSTPGQGATFTVLLPIAQPAPETDDQTITPLPMGSEHILVVDDEEDILTTSRMMLAHLGYSVTTSNTAVDALEGLKSGEIICDLVVTDQTMPDLTGLELAREIQRIRPGLPVILCTGYSDKVNEDSIRSVGAVGLLMKPVELRDLAILVRRALEHHHM